MSDVNKGGRPVQGDEAKRSAMAIRTTPTTKARLQDAADRGGRSLTQEIEQRLEWSLTFEDDMGGTETLDLLRIIATRIKQAEAKTGERWFNHYPTWSAAKRLAEFSFDDARPIPPNFPAIYRATETYTRELGILTGLYEEAAERFPLGQSPEGTANALLKYGYGGPGLSYKPDGTQRTEEELVEAFAHWDKIGKQAEVVAEAKAALQAAEEQEAMASREGMDIAYEMIAAMNYARRG